MKKNLILLASTLLMISCSSDDNAPVANDLKLSFKNTFKDTEIVLGNETSTTATENTSKAGQIHQFSELKYVVSNIRLITVEGREFPYHVNDLDAGGFVLNHEDSSSLELLLSNIPSDQYKQIKFGLGVRKELNALDELRFPEFYRQAGENDTEMMWEWGTGYRFVKIEGFYDTDKKQMSIHTGSTVEDDEEGNIIQGVDAYREIALDLPTHVIVGKHAPKIVINADFDHLLSGKMHTINLSTGSGGKDNATPNIHTAVQMMKFVENLGGDGNHEKEGMFSVLNIE